MAGKYQGQLPAGGIAADDGAFILRKASRFGGAYFFGGCRASIAANR